MYVEKLERRPLHGTVHYHYPRCPHGPECIRLEGGYAVRLRLPTGSAAHALCDLDLTWPACVLSTSIIKWR